MAACSIAAESWAALVLAPLFVLSSPQFLPNAHLFSFLKEMSLKKSL